jgi:hypothetical protein
MKNPFQHDEHGFPKPEKSGFWNKLGGGALSIAIIIHAILAIGGGIWVAQRILAPENKDPDFASSRGPAGDPAQPKAGRPGQSQANLSATARRIAANDIDSLISISNTPNITIGMSDLASLSGGDMPGSLTGPGGGNFEKGQWGNPALVPGEKSRTIFRLIDQTMIKRCSREDRLARLKENDGTSECEEAVVKGLRWLKANQNPDGSWGRADKSAMTGLALLAYFGHCETPASGVFSESSLKGIVYLVNLGIANNGVLAPNITAQSAPYEHAIGTYALGEAATFCKDLNIPSLMEVTQKAGQFIIDNQHPNGGWAYGYGTAENAHTDSSVVGWQLQALKACSHAKLKYDKMDKAVKKGLDYLSSLQNDNGGFGYNSKDPRIGLTGVGVLCFQMWNKGKSSEARKGVRFIKDNMRLDWNSVESDLYAHYYISQAMMQAGGGNWRAYNDIFRDQLLNNQNPDGSWRAPQFVGHGQTVENDVYRNTLCILMLEVYYRFLVTSGASRIERPDI